MIGVGDWVNANYLGTRLTGYVVEVYGSCFEVQVTLPKSFGRHRNDTGRITFDRYNVVKADDTPSPDDLHDLIDLALQLHDKEWFNQAIRGGEGA